MNRVVDVPSPSPEMDKIVDEILRGQRVHLFPPGLWAFVSVNLLVLIGGVLVTALVARGFASAEPSGRAIAHMVSVLAGAGLASAVAGFIVVGAPWAIVAVRRIVSLAIAFAVFGLLLALGGVIEGPLVPHLVAMAMLRIAYAITRTPSYFTMALFRQRLRVRRAAMYAALRARP
jgi:hypothetical protein